MTMWPQLVFSCRSITGSIFFALDIALFLWNAVIFYQKSEVHVLLLLAELERVTGRVFSMTFIVLHVSMKRSVPPFQVYPVILSVIYTVLFITFQMIEVI